jgi:hypothetical protein
MSYVVVKAGSLMNRTRRDRGRLQDIILTTGENYEGDQSE